MEKTFAASAELVDGKPSPGKGEVAVTPMPGGVEAKGPREGQAEGAVKGAQSLKSQKQALSIAERLSVFTGALTIGGQKKVAAPRDPREAPSESRTTLGPQTHNQNPVLNLNFAPTPNHLVPKYNRYNTRNHGFVNARRDGVATTLEDQSAYL